MSGRPSQAVTLAVRLVRERGYTVTAAAEKHSVSLSSIRRALRALNVPPMRGGRPKKASPA